MGVHYRYRCRSCGLTAVVSGGPDGGFLGKVRTVYCRPCGTLRDVATTYSLVYDTIDDLLRGEGRERPDEGVWRRNTCLVCGNTDLTPWCDGDPCPACGSPVTNEGDVAEWD